MDIQIDEPNILLIKAIKLTENSKTDVNDFIELFLENGPFQYLFSNLVGCSSFNHYKQIFSITFNKETESSIISDLLVKFLEPKTITGSNGIDYQVQINRPQKSQQMVTLYPMSHNITEEHIKTITQDWGKLVNYKFGRHRRCPILLNNYLHIFISDLKKEKIPDTIKINSKTITILIQGEENVPRCGYCKQRSHVIQNCPNKPQSREFRPHPQNLNTYAAKASLINNNKHTSLKLFTPPPRPSIPSTSKSIFSPVKNKSQSPQRPITPQIFPPTSNILTLPKSTPSSPTLSSSSEASTVSDSINFKTANQSAILLPHQQLSPPSQIDDFPPLQTKEEMPTKNNQNKRKNTSSSPSSSNFEKKPNKNKTPDINK